MGLHYTHSVLRVQGYSLWPLKSQVQMGSPGTQGRIHKAFNLALKAMLPLQTVLGAMAALLE